VYGGFSVTAGFMMSMGSSIMRMLRWLRSTMSLMMRWLNNWLVRSHNWMSNFVLNIFVSRFSMNCSMRMSWLVVDRLLINVFLFNMFLSVNWDVMLFSSIGRNIVLWRRRRCWFW